MPLPNKNALCATRMAHSDQEKEKGILRLALCSLRYAQTPVLSAVF
jgi:hypothetical protein